MPEVVFINPGVMDATDFAFAWRAVAKQVRDHFLPAWSGHLYVWDAANWPVSGFTDAKDLVPGSHFPIQVVASTGEPGILGDHTGLRVLWKAFGRTTPDPVTMSHEALELLGNPFLDFWVPWIDPAMMEAGEMVDRVEHDWYPVSVTIGGETRSVPVSNFLYPAAFGLAPGPRYDHMELLASRFENRGYAILRDSAGRVTNDVARGTPSSDAMSRTARIGA